MKAPSERLGAWVVRWRHAIVLSWLVAALAGGWVARMLPQRVVEGSGPLAGSASYRVEQALRLEFDRPLVEPLVLALESERYSMDEAPFRGWIADARARLAALPEVHQVVAPAQADAASALRSPDGHRAVLLIDLQSSDPAASERVVAQVRPVLAELRQRVRRDDPDARVALTGRAAATLDNYELNRSEGERAERLALPFTLLVLLLCFGAVGAAALPLAVGLAATSVALGAGCLLAAFMPVSGLLTNVVKMLGLALGIDYALLMVSHWRARAPDLGLEAALGGVLADAGATIAWSGFAVLLGLAGLLLSPLLETRSIGLAGMLVVCLAVLAALTLLPALLVLLGPRLEWPVALARVLAGTRLARLWGDLARFVTSHPWKALVLALGLSLGMALPGLRSHSGFDASGAMFPARMESRIGDEIVARLGHAQLTLPIHLIVRSGTGTPVLGQRAQLDALVERLTGDPRVASVMPPLAAFDAGLGDAALSRDRSAMLLQVFAHGNAGLAQVQALAHDIAQATPGAPMQLEVGGPPVYYRDHVERVEASFAPVFAFVTGASLLLLFVAFRSWLLPLKAVCANLLAVAAGYGAVVAVFQFGWLSSWIGVAQPLAAIPPVVPLLVFCLCFGLSMDYEVFLLRAIQRGWLRHADNTAATAQAMVATAPVITGAAAVMAVVFASFVATDLMLLKMLGVGLAVTVLVDATLIRCLLVPALVCVVGDWNWVPGTPARLRRIGARVPSGSSELHEVKRVGEVQ